MSARDKILDAAEARMRAVGYTATSFRDIANDVGVKSASVHYHFPQKEDLGEALVDRYAERQFARLESIVGDVLDPIVRAEALIQVHRDAFKAGGSICLCAMLSAESVGLPDRVSQAVERFFSGGRQWLSAAFQTEANGEARATSIFAALQGGLLIAAVARDIDPFDQAAVGALALARAGAVANA